MAMRQAVKSICTLPEKNVEHEVKNLISRKNRDSWKLIQVGI